MVASLTLNWSAFVCEGVSLIFIFVVLLVFVFAYGFVVVTCGIRLKSFEKILLYIVDKQWVEEDNKNQKQ